jgi:RNA polymerase sigma-70 factor (ECF subfamily)
LPSSLSLNPAAADPAARTREQRRRLTQIVKQYWDFTSRLLRHLGVSEADVEDGAQQVFLTLDQKLGDVLPGRERAFLAACAVHIAARVRRARARKREVGEESMLELVEIGADPERALEQQRRLERLERILGSMGEEHRAVFVLYEIEELTMAEVAEVLGIPPGTVASRLRRARELFREGLSS